MQTQKLPWDKMRHEYIYASATIRSLAAKYGCSKRAVEQRSVKEGWVKLREDEKTSVGQEARARIHEKAVDDHVSMYDNVRNVAQNMLAVLVSASNDPKQMTSHIVQVESTEYIGNIRKTKKWSEARDLGTVNGKNAFYISKAIKDLSEVVRTIDGIIEAPEKAKLDIEREKLELSKRQTGMSDGIEQETGIALMPGVDESLLDNALPDPSE